LNPRKRRNLLMLRPEAGSMTRLACELGDTLESARKLSLVEAMAEVGHWRYDLRTGQVTWSPEVYRIHGVSPDTFDPNLDRAVGAYHPDDRPILEAFIHRAQTTGEGYEFVLRLQRISDNATRIVTAKAEVETDENGAPQALFGVFQDVTERELQLERLSAALQAADVARTEALKSEARFRALAENGSDVTMQTDLAGVLVYVSPSVERVAGYSAEEMVGRPTLSFVHPDDRAGIEAAVRQAVGARAAGPMSRLQSRIIHKDGHVVWLENAPSLLVDPDTKCIIGITDVVRDISRRKAAERAAEAALNEARLARAAAEESETRYRLLADHSSDIVVRAGRDGVIRYASPACRTLGVTPEQAIGRSTLDFVAPQDRAYAARIVSDLFSGAAPDRSVRREYRVVCADGSHVWMEGNPSLVRNCEGAPVEFITSFRDVTARREMEDELARARDAAEAAAAAKAEFLANVSHELRTPLTSIIGFARVLQQRLGGDRDVLHYARTIGEAGADLLAMVNELLSMAQLDAEPTDLSSASFGLRECVGDIVDLVADRAAEKGLALDVRIDPSLPNLLIGDGARVRQVLLNLIANAIKFTAAGQVRVVVESEDDMVAFRVIDTGVGIAPDQRSRIFQRFVQVDGGAERSHGGVGLGLAISQKLAELMGGSIGVESAEGRGSEFWFKLRLDPSPAGAPAPSSACRILVIEDQKAIQDLLVALLRPFGHEVDVACDGLDGLAALRRRQYDIVIMDAHMPIVSGAAATFMIRHLEGEAARTPIIALTADASLQTAASLLEAGADAVITKPIEIDRLVDAIARLSPASPQGATFVNARSTVRR
jgi:PAS domain S-box-containing protein